MKKTLINDFSYIYLKKELRVKALSSEHSCHDNKKYSTSIIQENYDEFNIINRKLTDRFLFEREKKTRMNRQMQDRKSIEKTFLDR